MIYVLCSGGMDSWIHLNWAVAKFGIAQVTPIYYYCGQACADREVAAAYKLCARLGLKLRTKHIGPLYENPETGHVTFRNLHFILDVAMRPDSNGVVFGMLLGEDSEDKTPKFVSQMQDLIDGQLAANWHHAKRDFKIYTPYSLYTKSQMLAKSYYSIPCELLFMGIYDSVACYTTERLPCGACMSCVNRWVALVNNGFPEEEHNQHPAEYMLDRIAKILKNKAIDVPRANTLTRKWYSWATLCWLYEMWYALNSYTKKNYRSSVYRELKTRMTNA